VPGDRARSFMSTDRVAWRPTSSKTRLALTPWRSSLDPNSTR
jgi:hypothetical protein